MKDKIKEMIDDTASEVANKANECCHRSDGYREEIESLIKEKITLIAEYIFEICY